MSVTRAQAPIRVLLVEDNLGDARLILEMLRELEADVFELDRVDRLSDAIEHLGAERVDVVLLDLGLPDSQGLATFERAHLHAPTEPIVVISGLDDERLALEAVRSGAQDYLVKGRIDGQLLSRVLRYAIERKHAAAQRDEAAEWIRRLSMAVDQSPAATFITDLSGTIEYVNARFTQVTGYSSEEAVGRSPRILSSGRTEPDVYRDLWTTILSGAPWRGEILNRKKDGTLYWDAAWISPIRGPDGRVTHFLALQEDVTERRAMVETLRDREERFRQVTEAIHEVYFLVDVGFSEVLYVSPAFEEIWGRTSQSLYEEPRSFLDPILPEDLPGLLAAIEDLRRGGEPAEYECRLRRPGGGVRWIMVHMGGVTDSAGATYRLAGVALDVTKRKEAEEALRANEARLRTLFETVNLIVLALDRDARVEYVNPYFLELTGFTAEEARGLDWFETFIPEADRGPLSAVFHDLVERDMHPHYQSTIVTRTGEERRISWHNTVMRDAQDRPTGTLSVGEDVTEHARLEEQYRQSQKMEAVGRLAGGVAHDFNNLLTAILGLSELMLADLDPGDALRHDLGEIKAAAERAGVLTRQLLAFSRQQVLESRAVDLNALIVDLDRMLRRVIGEDIGLRTVPGAELGTVRADPGQIEQVILNLAINSRDAMPRGGLLTIETANVVLDESTAAVHASVRPGRYVMLAVADTGIGMDAATRAKIFEPFFTTKPRDKGTGLGLATAYGIVKQSDGYIWVYSEPGRGTTFKIYLPRVEEPAETLARDPGRPESLDGSEQILVVEDDEAVRNLTCKILEGRGYRVLAAGTGPEAIELAERHPGSLPLLLTDVVMPGMSGRELAERLVARHPGMRVLYMSGYTDEAVVHHGVLAGSVHFLQKPFTPDRLAHKVRQVLDARAPER